MSQRVAGHVRTQRRAVPRPIPRARLRVHAHRPPVHRLRVAHQALHHAEAHLRAALPALRLEATLRHLRNEHRSNVPVSVVRPLHLHRSVAILHHAHVALRKRVVRQAVFLNLQ